MEMTLLFFMYPGCCHRKFLGAKRFLALVIYYYFSGGGCICCPSCVKWWWSKMTVMYRCTVRKKIF